MGMERGREGERGPKDRNEGERERGRGVRKRKKERRKSTFSSLGFFFFLLLSPFFHIDSVQNLPFFGSSLNRSPFSFGPFLFRIFLSWVFFVLFSVLGQWLFLFFFFSLSSQNGLYGLHSLGQITDAYFQGGEKIAFFSKL